MIYHVIGTMSGSSLDGLDIAYVEIWDVAGQWEYTIHQAATATYTQEWVEKLRNFEHLSAREYAQLDSDLGYYMGELILDFIQKNDLTHKIHFVCSHGHTSFHEPQQGYTAQIGSGANIASIVNKPTIDNLRQMDVAYGGQGAPIVPLAEKLLFSDYTLFLNIGGITNLSVHKPDGSITAYDITAANRVLNLLTNKMGLDYDDQGQISTRGTVQQAELDQLNAQDYFSAPYPKSLANQYGTDVLFPIVDAISEVPDALATYTEHIAMQLHESLSSHEIKNQKMLITGGGAYNRYLVERIADRLQPLGIEIEIPDAQTIEYKEALAMALLGVLRWREEPTVLDSYSGATQPSVGGALWAI